MELTVARMVVGLLALVIIATIIVWIVFLTGGGSGTGGEGDVLRAALGAA
jgi:hypothetical protein